MSDRVWFVLAGIVALLLGAAMLQGAIIQEIGLGPLRTRFARPGTPPAGIDKPASIVGGLLVVCGVVLIGVGVLAGRASQAAKAAAPAGPEATSLVASPPPDGSASAAPLPTPSTTPASATPRPRTTRGPWIVRGSGVVVSVERVTRQADPGQQGAEELVVPIDVTSNSDLSDFEATVLDQAGNNLDPNPTFPPNKWNYGPQAGITARSILIFSIDPSAPPRSLTMTFKDFFWSADQRLRIDVPVPA